MGPYKLMIEAPSVCPVEFGGTDHRRTTGGHLSGEHVQGTFPRLESHAEPFSSCTGLRCMTQYGRRD